MKSDRIKRRVRLAVSCAALASLAIALLAAAAKPQQKIPAAGGSGGVSSFNTRTGTVALTAADVEGTQPLSFTASSDATTPVIEKQHSATQSVALHVFSEFGATIPTNFGALSGSPPFALYAGHTGTRFSNMFVDDTASGKWAGYSTTSTGFGLVAVTGSYSAGNQLSVNYDGSGVLQNFLVGPIVSWDVNGNVAVGKGIQSTSAAFFTLAACASGTEGTMAAVTDSTTNTWGATITGSGTNHVLAYCDGTNWTVAGK